MNLHPCEIYHVYNRGNNRQPIFFEEENYLYFLSKIEKCLIPCCELMAYCLMPNHFHFLIYATEVTTSPYSSSAPTASPLNRFPNYSKFSHGIKQLLSSYTKAINKKYNRTGSLFAQNTKAKSVSGLLSEGDYCYWCFRYIHNNPVRANLVSKPEEWQFSSYSDYYSSKVESICNRELTREELALDLYVEPSDINYELKQEVIDRFY
jgi:REP element-mobilizing transposase RayT